MATGLTLLLSPMIAKATVEMVVAAQWGGKRAMASAAEEGDMRVCGWLKRKDLLAAGV